MTLAELKSYVFRRARTNATNYAAADMVVDLNNANTSALALIRGLTDNFLPTAWTTSDLSTGTVTPIFDSNFHEIVGLRCSYQFVVDNDLTNASALFTELQVMERRMETFYGARNYKIFTVTIASPGVFTRKQHKLQAGDRVIFSTSATLPTGLSANVWYWVISAGLTEDEFEIATTKDGTAINTSVSQSVTEHSSSVSVTLSH